MARGFEEFSHENGRPADRVADAALSWLHADRDKRFFCMVHFIDPHPPYRAPEPFFGRFAERDPVTFVPHVVSDLPEADRERLIGRYDEEIAFLDQELGRLLDGLDDLDDTLVIFAADHGEEFFDHGSLEHGHTLMQELLRVPLVIVGPGVAARRSAEPVTLADIPLTVLDAAGVDTDLRSENGVVGTSLWPLLTRDEAEPLQPGHARTLFAESKLYGTERKAIVEWPYKLILDPRTGARRLFDLEDDPRERSDLSQGHGEIADRLEATLRQRLLARPPVRGPVEAPEEETKRQLEALGYVN